MAKPQITLTTLGHVDCGKSTLTGNLVYNCGGLSAAQMKRVQVNTNSFRYRRSDLNYCLVTYRNTREMERGFTIDLYRGRFETAKYSFDIIDFPGHRDFIKNMITGASQADVGLLLVATEAWQFDIGFSKEGQTYEHSVLAFALGIKQLIIVINQMDDLSTNWSQIRYEKIKEYVSVGLKRSATMSTKSCLYP
jgi:elongation factor 1-alpha